VVYQINKEREKNEEEIVLDLEHAGCPWDDCVSMRARRRNAC
jgi:hypothetical protein